MQTTSVILLLVFAALVSAAIGALLMYLRIQNNINQLKQNNAALQATLDSERKAASEKLKELEKAREQLSQTFSALSSEALKANNEQFLKLASENLKQLHLQAQNELNTKEKSFENLIKPIKETLEKTDKQLRQFDQEHKQAHGALTRHLQLMQETQQALQGETRNLVNALRRPEVRGRWGELTLKRLAELAGMVEHCDFYEQEHTLTEQGALRPDMIVRMPGQREIVVDVKTSLDAYINAMEASDENSKALALQKHTDNIKKRIKELSGKAYWSQFERSPDFVVMFIPGDQFLSSALDQEPGLLENAMQQKVILATPTSLVALLRAIAYGWRQEALTENAELIRQLGDELYTRLLTYTEHLNRLGKSLNSSVQSYNKAVGSFDSRILPSARKFTELGVHSNKEMEPPVQIESSSRSIESPGETRQPADLLEE